MVGIKMKKYLLIILFCTPFLFSQENNYVEFSSDKGRLTITDDQKAEFGRYDGFELNLNAGENLYFMAFSEEFPPIVAVADSLGKVLAEDFGNDDGLVSINTIIKKSGTYFLYILNRTNSLGNYLFQYAITSSNMLKYNGKDFCNLSDFLLKHSKAYFVFLQDPKSQLLNSQQFLDAYLDEENVSVNLRLNESDNFKEIETKLKTVLADLKKCGLSNWKESKKKNMDNSEFDESKIILTENVKTNPRTVELTLFDYSKLNDNSTKKYILELSFSKAF